MDLNYWQRQTADKPLYPDIEWQKPEQKALAGKLLIIGGNSHGFAAVAQAHQDALQAGAGECRVVLPDALKKTVGSQAIDCVFVPTNQSGGITKDSITPIKAAIAWADAVLYIGDAGRNSETAIVYEQLLAAFPDKPTFITRDAIDLIKGVWPTLLNHQAATIVITLAQLQKLFQAVYYPKPILFSTQVVQLVETMHKFTITYPLTVVVFHQNQLLVASGGKVTTTPWDEPMLIWRGSVAAKATTYAVHHPSNRLAAISASLVAGN